MWLSYHTERPKISGFRYFWMKRVTGFAPGSHCARCLVGAYEKAFSLAMPVNVEVRFEAEPGELFYACGVALPYRWANNLHLAMRAAPGASCEVHTYHGDRISVQGAERIVFDDAKARELFPDRNSSYLTCRNFQFGAALFCD